ncbi:MAG TPA: hypothetical protein VMM13_05825, partial [Euzebya sp.]|nr:hypothetical protein [Euzebya sp.]
WAAGPGPAGGIRLVQATYQEVVPHVGTVTLPFEPSPDRPLRIAPVDGAVWISGLVDGEDPVIVRVDQETGEVTHQRARTGEVFAADTPGDVLLLDATRLTRVATHDLTTIRSGDPLPDGLGEVGHVWYDRGNTVVVGDGTAGGTVVWDVSGAQLRQSQLTEPVVAATATVDVDRVALATADGDIEIIDLTNPGPGQLLDARHDAPVRHVRLTGPRLEVAYADGHTSTHIVPTN